MLHVAARGGHRHAWYDNNVDILANTTARETMAVIETDDLTAHEVSVDPYAYFGQLRETDPVHWNELFKFWIVTRHSDVSWVLRNPEMFSSATPTNVAGLPSGDARDAFPPVPESDWPAAEVLRDFRPFIMHDPPTHRAMRQAVHRWFTPRAVEKWRARLRAKAVALITDRYEAGEMEIKVDFATPLPLVTICWMLGVPENDATLLRKLAAHSHDIDFGPDRVRLIADTLRELSDYFAELLETRAKQPSDDLLSMLVEGEREGVFTRKQSIDSAIHLMIAGHETTLDLITNGVLAFIRNPDQWDLLRSAPEDLCGSATEECLRYDPSLKLMNTRIAAKDVELGGKTLRAGELVFWCIASANRDPDVFADPDRFDITRSPNRHLAFGLGIHHCLGAALGRIEGQEAFKALVERFPRLHLKKEVEYPPRLAFRELSALHVGWDVHR